MANKWPILKNPPIVLAIFQIKYKLPDKFDIMKFYKAETTSRIKEHFPKRNTNYNSNILDLESTPAPGISTFKAKADTKANVITYSSDKDKKRIIIDFNSLTLSSEESYTSWDDFKKESIETISYFSSVLSEIEIERVSIRFVNRFELDINDNILDYFNLTISTNRPITYPITKYSFKYIVSVPNDDKAYSIINHSMEPIDDKLIYLLDIDALNWVKFDFDKEEISEYLEKLREIKNVIFFENVTEKTIDICNSQQ